MNWIAAVTIAIGGLVLALPTGLIFELQVRLIAFVIYSIFSPTWQKRPWSPWKIGDWIDEARRRVFWNQPPRLTRRQTLIVRAIAVIVAYCSVWMLYFHLPG